MRRGRQFPWIDQLAFRRPITVGIRAHCHGQLTVRIGQINPDHMDT
jgi:hypothetical protein